MTADICVIVNPGSGKRRGREAVEALRREFEAWPGRFALRVAPSGEAVEATARGAVADGFATVAAAGGDGTICAVASAVLGSGARLGVLPLGTFNYFARSLELPQDRTELLRVLVEGASRRVDVGVVNGRVFLNNASLGLYPTILRRREQVYGRWGRSRLAAHWSLISTILDFRRPLRLRVSVDGEVRRVRTPLLFVASNPRQLEEIGVAGAEGMAEGAFAVFIAPDCAGWRLLVYVARLAARRMTPGRDFELLHGVEIVAETERRRLPVARDGERELLEAPFRFELLKDALDVAAPAAGGSA